MSTTISNIIVSDSISHAPLSGANVFVNGVSAGTTDSTGNISLTLTTGAGVSISVKMSGYQTVKATLNGGQDLFVNMPPNQAPGPVTINLTVNPEAPADAVVFTFSNGSNPVSIPYKIGGLSVPGLTQGDQIVSGTVTGFNPVSELINVTPTNLNFTINLVTSSDTGLANKQQTIPTVDPDTSSMLPPITPEASPEFVAPNTEQGTYFTMTQARVYIGNLFIDELNGLQFALQDNKIPIFGYASRFYDAVAQGRSLVQGQFTINFISEGYLVSVLKEYANMIDTEDDPTESPTIKQQQDRLLTLTNKLSNPNGADPSWTPDQIQAAKKEINTLAAALGPDALTLAQGGISANVRKQIDSILGLPGGDYPNAVYEDTAFDIVIQYSGAGRVITRRLEDCHLISNESIMDHSGTPILDSYGFIARRLR